MIWVLKNKHVCLSKIHPKTYFAFCLSVSLNLIYWILSMYISQILLLHQKRKRKKKAIEKVPSKETQVWIQSLNPVASCRQTWKSTWDTLVSLLWFEFSGEICWQIQTNVRKVILALIPCHLLNKEADMTCIVCVPSELNGWVGLGSYWLALVMLTQGL